MKWFGKLKAAMRPAERDVVEEAVLAVPESDKLDGLTRRERQVFALLLEGRKQREIAELLSVRPTTISFHTQSLYRKLGIHDRAQLFIQYALPGMKQREASEEEER